MLAMALSGRPERKPRSNRLGQEGSNPPALFLYLEDTMPNLEALKNQRDEIEQYEDDSIYEMIELLLEGKIKREGLVEAYLILWANSDD
jgi:hypothetical protein